MSVSALPQAQTGQLPVAAAPFTPPPTKPAATPAPADNDGDHDGSGSPGRAGLVNVKP